MILSYWKAWNYTKIRTKSPLVFVYYSSPPSPPYKKVSLSRHFLLFFCRVLIQKHGFLLYWVPTGNKPVKTISAGTISLHPGADWWKKEVEWKTEISWCPFFSRTLSPRFKVYASGNIPHASPCTSMGENLWHMMLPEVSMQTMLDIAGAYAGSEQHRLLFCEWKKEDGHTILPVYRRLS